MANQKMKTKRAAAKRLMAPGRGRLKRNKANHSHILTKKSTKRKRAARNRKKILVLVAGVLVLFLLSFLVVMIVKKLKPESIEGAGEALSRTEIDESNRIRQSILDEANMIAEVNYNGHNYKYNENIDVLLIMGLDDRDLIDYTQVSGMDKQACADLILLAIFDKDKKTYSLLQINRDTMADVMMYDTFGTFMCLDKRQICLSHIYRKKHEEACEDTRFAVSHLLYDVGIDNYFAVTMDSISIINDSVGGVTVTIEDDFSQIDPTFVQGQTITLHGDQAETYVRSRGGIVNSPTNINRMNRQRTYMSALLTLLGQKTKESSSFAVDLFDKLSPYMVTDCSHDQLNTYISQFSDYTLDKIITPDGTAEIGEDDLMEFKIDNASLRGIVIDLFYVRQD